MSQERRRSPKLAQARRRHTTHDAEDESDENDNGAPLIDDSASEAPSEDELQLSASDNEDEGQEEPEDGKTKVREHSKDSASPPTSESYDRLEDDTLQGVDFVDLAASNGSVGPARVTDTAIMLNGFKDISAEKDVEEDTAMHFDELDDSISFEPRPSDKKPVSMPSTRMATSTSTRGGARDRPDRETYWQRRNREKEEYKKRLEDPTFTPFVGDFFMHDSREKRQFDSLNQFGTPRGRGRGRGGRGFRGGPQREMPARDDTPQEALWDHAGFEELEPQPPPQPKVYFIVALSHKKGTAKSQTSSVGRQTPQHNVPTGIAASQHAPRKDSVSTQDTTQPPSRPAKNHYNNLTALTSTQISINISLPNTEIVVKDITLNSYVGRIPYQKPLRGDRPVKISSIEGAGNREIFPSKERSWLPYFLKNAAANAAQVRDGLHSRGGSVASTGTPSNLRPARNVNGTPTKVPYSAVYAPSFNPAEDEDEKTTKIKVNLPPTVNTASSASPAVSDSSSLHVHHPRPTKHINIADIDDSSARLKAFLNPQTSSSPAHSHERTSSTQIPETAVHAAPFQPTSFLPTQQQPHQQQIPVPFPPNVPYYYPAYPALPPEYPPPPPTTTQNPYIPQQPRYESNGMVYYYDPAAYYYYQAPPTGTPTQQQTQPPPPPPPHQHHQQNQPSEQPDPPPAAQQAQQQMYYYHPSQMPVTDPSRSMGMYFPYQQGT